MRLDACIDLMQEITAEQIITGGAIGTMREAPAILEHQRMHDRHRNMVGQVFQQAENQCPVRPRAGIGYIEMVASALGLEPALARRAGTAIGGDPVTMARILADEMAT